MITPFGDIPATIYYGIILSTLLAMVGIPCFLVYLKFFSGNIIHIKLMKLIGKNYKEIKHIKVKPTVTTFTYGEKEFPISGEVGYIKNNELNILYDVDKSCAIHLESDKRINMSPETYRTITKQKFHSLIFEEGAMEDWMGIVIIGGVVVAILIGVYSIYMIGDLSDKLNVIINALPKPQVIK